MNWPSLEAFWHMGGYGLYVWSSFGACALLAVLEPLTARRRYQRALRQIQAQAPGSNPSKPS